MRKNKEGDFGERRGKGTTKGPATETLESSGWWRALEVETATSTEVSDD